MKDLFVGSLGRANNHGGSRMCAIPHTIGVEPEYEVATDVPSVAEFVTCTLDGRLWVWKRSRRYYIAVFRWDEDTEKLVFVSTTVLSGETVIKRGVDWILTDKSLILSSDEDPYISRTEYDSDDTSYIDAINQSYSFFPEFETWQKIQSGQVIHIADAPNQEWQEMPNGLITPLEFHYYSDDDIQAITDFKPQICYCNGQLYAKGKAHIGRAYLLPHTLNINGEVVTFYLYISPDYLRNYDSENQTFNDNDGWDKLILAPLTKDSVCIFTPESKDYGFCKKSVNSQVISLPQLEQFDFSEDNGVIFFDGLTHSNLVFNDNGASFLYDNLSYECKGLRQWLAPAGSVDAVTPDLVIASCDNATLVTHIQGFHRELLAGKTLPITAKAHSDKRLSVVSIDRHDKKSIQINSINEPITDKTIYREDIYRSTCKVNALSLKKSATSARYIELYLAKQYFLHIYDNNTVFRFWLAPYPLSCTIRFLSEHFGRAFLLNGKAKFDTSWNLHTYVANINDYDDYKIAKEHHGTLVFLLTHINPNTKEIISTYHNIDLTDYGNFYFLGMEVRNNMIGIRMQSDTGEDIFIPCCNVPEYLFNWQDAEHVLQFDNIGNNLYAVFTSNCFNTYNNFQLYINLQQYHTARTFLDINSLENNIYTRALVVINNKFSFNNEFSFLVQYLSANFDFKSEIERSKFHELDLPQ